ncbi:MAG: SH3 domain-containing protein [Candidatus Korobacteraceae bacterium]
MPPWHVLCKSSCFSVFLLMLALLAGCAREEPVRELAYIAVPQTFIRDRVAPVYQRIATVHNADRVEVLDRRRRFALVRLDSGEEGWIQERYLVTQQVFEVAHKLPESTRSLPSQAAAVTRAAVNLHILPGRETPHLYQLKADEPVHMLKRTPRARDQAQAAAVAQRDSSDDGKDEVSEPPPLPMEDWWLIRTADGRYAGWVLGRLVFVDLPLEVAQYSEGARIVAFFVLNEVEDGGERHPQYLVFYTDSKDGLPYDYNQARVFSWNPKRHRYETAYRERGLEGFLPVEVGMEDFGKEGTFPTFAISARTKQGEMTQRKYRLMGPVVRRVTTQAISSPAPPVAPNLTTRR